MTVQQLVLPSGRGYKREKSLSEFATVILKMNEQASQKMSSRGWCYFLEGQGTTITLEKLGLPKTLLCWNWNSHKGRRTLEFLWGISFDRS